MRSMLMRCVVTAALAAAANSALADGQGDGFPGEFSANFGFVNDYRFRGITQTGEDPAVQGGLDYSVDLAEGFGLYLGAWGSSVDFNDGDQATVEIDYYAGLTKTIGPVDLSAGGIFYSYPGAADNLNYDYFEIAATASVTPIENLTIGVGYNYSPEYFGHSGDFHYPSASFEYAIPLETPVALTLGGTIGYNSIEDEAAFGVTDDYADWSLSLSASYKILNFSVAYVDNDEPGRIGDAAVVFKVGASF